ncbi:MAG: VOC family protein [Proteobacteria bacterium]|nr:VOC family protein [Pseudomonadota bacterium]
MTNSNKDLSENYRNSVLSLNRSSAVQFIDQIMAEAQSLGINIDALMVDHVCFRVGSIEEYEAAKFQISNDMGSDLQGHLLTEAQVNGRLIATYRLCEPLIVQGKMVEALEIPAPKASRSYESGFEHIEVVIRESFVDFQLRHPEIPFDTFNAGVAFNGEIAVSLPSGKVKFHHLPLSCVIAIEEHRAGSFLKESDLLQRLLPWDPVISGSVPLGVDVADSDIDVLLWHPDLKRAGSEISAALESLGRIEWTQEACRQGECLVGRLNCGFPFESTFQFVIEFFVSNVSSFEQHSHLHLLAEYKILVQEGLGFREGIRKLKSTGLSTEQAFCQKLGIVGDPYEALLLV